LGTGKEFGFDFFQKMASRFVMRMFCQLFSAMSVVDKHLNPNTMKKIINFIVPFLYLIPVFLVILHQTDYQPMRALAPPFIFYIIIAGIGFTIIRMIIKQAAEDEKNE
jgi:cell division protein FtsW (lipid II flippase)